MPGSAPVEPPGENRCTILADSFDYLVQLVLGVTCLCVILTKWYWEGPRRRPFWIFVADLLKQGGGFFLAHIGNVVMSKLLQSDASPCVWYFINIFLDCTVRVVLAFWALRLVQRVVLRWDLDPRGLISFGEYGRPGLSGGFCGRWEHVVRPVLYQCLVWYGIVVVTRVIMGLLVWALAAQLADLGDWLLGPLEHYSHDHGHDLELVVVMMIIPAVLIALQLWVQDAFLQGSRWSGGSTLLRYCPCCRLCGRGAALEEAPSSAEYEDPDCHPRRGGSLVNARESIAADGPTYSRLSDT
eukprot:TRINITY_DN12914_c1_g1_i1.p1 TRINITY_DN12914_c1_g1~~TRINITY_DN12914_c1_g1_i1.p1  ORF type:complete len:323 (+),score=127.68 TRINITY_DN12914_c1_g1_i1:78-971(+)